MSFRKLARKQLRRVLKWLASAGGNTRGRIGYNGRGRIRYRRKN